MTILADADASDRWALYTALGPRLTYEPDRRRVMVECRPDSERLCKSSCRRGDLNPQGPKSTWPSTVEGAPGRFPLVPDCAAEQGISTCVRPLRTRPSQALLARMLPRCCQDLGREHMDLCHPRPRKPVATPDRGAPIRRRRVAARFRRVRRSSSAALAERAAVSAPAGPAGRVGAAGGGTHR